MKRISAILLALVLVFSLASTAYAAETPVLSYELQLTDQNGMPVENPRSLHNGDTLNVEIVLRRTDANGPYDLYGIEFRLLTIGLEYNNDGTTLRSGTDIREENYSDGKYVGFAWYDMQQVGENTNNPVLAGKWSYTVSDASKVNIRVPVSLVYVKNHTEGITATGPATIQLELNLGGGELIGPNISGKYVSGTVVTLPDAQREGYVFLGWSDGLTIYPAGSKFVVSGIVTLEAIWEAPELNRHLQLDPNGGEIVGEDISGYYADGMIVTLPDAQREGYMFKGWSDGMNTYEAGAEYIVYNTVIIVAQWEENPEGSDSTVPGESDKPGEGEFSIGKVLGGGLLAAVLAALMGWLWWLLLLWKRKTVKYSLITGDVSLDFKNGDEPVEVSVVLYDGEKEYHLNKSGTVEVKHRLKFIKNVRSIPMAAIEPGTYKGKLLIHEANKIRVRKCRIKALNEELKGKYAK